MTQKGKSSVAPSVGGKNVGSLEREPPSPEALAQRDETYERNKWRKVRRSLAMPAKKKSFVNLTRHGEAVGSLKTELPLPPPKASGGNNRTAESNNIGRILPRLSFSSNIFKSRSEKSEALTEQLRREEEDSMSHSRSGGSGSFRVPYAQVTGDQSSSVPSPEFLQKLPQNWNSSAWSHPWNESLSSMHSSQHSRGAINQNDDNPMNANNGDDKPPTEPTRFDEFRTECKSLLFDLIEYSKAKTWKKKVLTVIFFVVSSLVFYDLFFGKQEYIYTWLQVFIVWMTTHHTGAVFAFIAIFTLSTLAFVPPTLLVFGAGYAFTVAMDSVLGGVTAAVISSFMGSCIGAIIAFARSRYMMRDLVKLFANRYPLIRAVDQALKVKHGFRIMLFLRLCPIIPFNGLNYCCGITGVTLHEFTLSLVGILPFQIYTSILGATAGAVELQNLQNDEYTKIQKTAFVGFTVTGVLFGIVGVVYAYRLVKTALKRELNLSTKEFESMIRPAETVRTDIESASYHLQDGSDDPLRDGKERTESSSRSGASVAGLRYQEEGEEWFWMWA